MRLIKKALAFILLIVMNIINGGLRIASFIINKMAPGLSLLTVVFAIYVYSRAGFVADKIIPILGVAFLIATIGVIMPYFVRGTIELEKELHDYVFNYEACVGKYKQPKVDYTNTALAHKLMLTRIK